MTGCIVCDQPEGWCEFCPHTPEQIEEWRDLGRGAPLDPIIDRDPGDETTVLIGEAPPRSWPVELIDNLVVFHPASRTTARSYKATFKCGDTYRTETIMGHDSYTATVNALLDNPREGWALVSLTELT